MELLPDCYVVKFVLVEIDYVVPTKGNLISKALFGILEFFQKTNEQIRFYYNQAKVKKENSFVRFLEEFEDTKSAFEIN